MKKKLLVQKNSKSEKLDVNVKRVRTRTGVVAGKTSGGNGSTRACGSN
jgi:hypothetical protein